MPLKSKNKKIIWEISHTEGIGRNPKCQPQYIPASALKLYQLHLKLLRNGYNVDNHWNSKNSKLPFNVLKVLK